MSRRRRLPGRYIFWNSVSSQGSKPEQLELRERRRRRYNIRTLSKRRLLPRYSFSRTTPEPVYASRLFFAPPRMPRHFRPQGTLGSTGPSHRDCDPCEISRSRQIESAGQSYRREGTDRARSRVGRTTSAIRPHQSRANSIEPTTPGPALHAEERDDHAVRR